MKKNQSDLKQDEKKLKQVLVLTKSEGAYGLDVYEIDENIIEKHGKKVEKYEPDVFAIFANNITKASRGIFGI